MRIPGIWSCSLGLMLLFGLGCSPAAKPEHLGYIMPGKGIKDAAIAEERSKVEASWGQPDDVYQNPFDADNVIVAYHQKGVEISYRHNQVDCVSLYPQKDAWQAYEGATQNGVWVLSDEKEVRRIMGEPVNEAPQALNYPGLTVYVSAGKVDYLTVTALPEDALQGTGSAAEASGAVDAGAAEGAKPAVTDTETFNLQQEDNPAADSIDKLRRRAKELSDKENG